MAQRGNGGIIGPANVPTNQVATGVWNLEEQQIAKSLGAWPSDYRISRSLRFNSADSAYLNRTPAGAGNRTTWTWSFWVKLCSSSIQRFVNASTGNYDDTIAIASDTIRFQLTDSSGAFVGQLITNQVFRDYSAWYHIVAAWDTTQATSSNRMKLYINGSQVTSFSTATYPAQNTQSGAMNTAIAHYISSVTGTLRYFDGYMTEVNFIDGQALTPSSFGQTNANTGVWEPKPYAGSYGTNGFYLNFSDNSNTTATTLGKDYSGNGNNWTPNNFSVSAGAGNDSLVDVPTPWGTDTGVGGSVRGNYATLNPLQLAPSMLMSNGNLYLLNDNTSEHYGSAPSTIGVRTGKWYAEFTAIAVAGTPSWVFGIARATWSPAVVDGGGWYGRWYYTSEGYAYRSDGKFITSNTLSGSPATYGANDVIGVAIDLDAQTISFYKNGVSQGTPFTSIPLGVDYVFAGGAFTNNTKTNQGAFFANFGQRPFAYTAPSGFKALCTQNLPTPTVGATASTQANKYFDATLFTGTGSPLTVVNAGGFQPDLVWTKNRSSVAQHYLTNVLSGVSQYLVSNDTSAEQTGTQLYTSFNSNGFSMGTSGYPSGAAVVAWQWKANGAGVNNTAGSITSTVSANTTSGFSIATFTAQSSGTATVGHGLGAVPKMVIIKGRSSGVTNWTVYHASIGATGAIQLNLTNASDTSIGYWNNTNPTSSVFTLGSGFAGLGTFVAYCFAEVPGFSKFGSYTGNGSTDGPFVYCGFRPAYVMIKASSAADFGSWRVHDTKRSPSNVVDKLLIPNLADAESTFVQLDILSNGFKIRENYSGLNANGQTLIFAAFAEAPQKFALAR